MVEHLHVSPRFRSALIAMEDVACRTPDAGTGPEEHATRHEIVFVRRGAFIRHTGRDRAVADVNGVLFFNRGDGYRVTHPVAGGDDCTVLAVAPQALLDAARHVRWLEDSLERPFARPSAPVPLQASVRLHTLRRMACQPARAPVALEESALGLLVDVLAETGSVKRNRAEKLRQATRRRHAELTEAAQITLARSLSDPPTLDELAQAIGTSPFHLMRVFRSQTGMTIHRYLQRLRLRTALERLADGVDDLTGLALDLGFCSHAHFTDTFRRAFGIPPSAFRSA